MMNSENTVEIDHNEQYRQLKVGKLKEMCKERQLYNYSKLNKKELYDLLFNVVIDDEVAKSRKGYGGKKPTNSKTLYNMRKQAGLDKNYSKSLCERIVNGDKMFTVDIYNYEQVSKLKFVEVKDILIYWDITPKRTNKECLEQILEKINENELYSDAPRTWNSLYEDKINFDNYSEWFNNIEDQNLKKQEIELVWAKNPEINIEKIKNYF